MSNPSQTAQGDLVIPPSIVDGIANMVLGIGAFGILFALMGEDLMAFLTYIALPVMLAMVASKKMSLGTLQLILNGELYKRVQAKVEAYASTPAELRRTQSRPPVQ